MLLPRAASLGPLGRIFYSQWGPGPPGPLLFSVFCFSKRPPARHPEAARPPTDPEIKNARPRAHRNEATLEPIVGVAHLLSDRLRRRGSFVEVLFNISVKCAVLPPPHIWRILERRRTQTEPVLPEKQLSPAPCCQVLSPVRCDLSGCRAQLSGIVRCLCQTSCQVLSVLSGAVGCVSDSRGAL